MTLQDWYNNGWLKQHTSSASEVKDLLEKVNRDISEANKTEISLDWRLAIGYNACLGCGIVALYVSGYRMAGGTGKHYRTIQSLRYTLNPDPELILSLEVISKKRGIVSYNAAGVVGEAEVNEAIQLAVELREQLLSWLNKKHPELLD